VQAIVFGTDEHEQLSEVPVPEPGRGEVLLRVEFCGICGSDLHAAPPDFRVGVTMGHELAGTVVAAGPDVAGWGAGDRACVNPNGDWCGTCARCRAGAPNMCPRIWDAAIGLARDGGMAACVAVPARTLHRLPAAVSSRAGAWVEPLAVACRTVRRSEIALGESAIVFGCGPIGLLVLQLLRAAGAAPIVAVEPSPLRARLAAACGADAVLDPHAGELDARLAPPRHAFDCTGVATTAATALRVLAPRGRLTVTGFARVDPSFRSADLLFKELEIRGSFIYVDEFDVAIDLLARGAVDVDALTTAVLPLESGLDAFAALRRPDEAVKILLRPSTEYWDSGSAH
jgi:2-desacetyl-2-hydroxyethyl bacteriochlorophyllide A dehydrogenase